MRSREKCRTFSDQVIGWTVRCTDPGRDSFFSEPSRLIVGGNSVCSSRAVGFSLQVNRPGREGDHSLPYNADLIMSGAINLLSHIPS